jgi:murein DD-endopeptidase MepM/ murein hydrolase activator NlpD
MGSYNSQYESYYSHLTNRGNSYKNINRKMNGKNLDTFSLSKRLIGDLIGVLVLFSSTLVCKMGILPNSEKVYVQCKSVVNSKFDYTNLENSISKFNIRQVEIYFDDAFQSAMAQITGEQKIKDTIKESYSLPVEGVVNKNFSMEHQGVDIEVKLNTPVKSCFSGTVKSVGIDEKNGKYIIVNHNQGVESKYCNLNDISVKENTILSKGDIIGNSGVSKEDGKPELYFELSYMGRNMDPLEYINK